MGVKCEHDFTEACTVLDSVLCSNMKTLLSSWALSKSKIRLWLLACEIKNTFVKEEYVVTNCHSLSLNIPQVPSICCCLYHLAVPDIVQWFCLFVYCLHPPLKGVFQEDWNFCFQHLNTAQPVVASGYISWLINE